jgi:hypothetical protein
MTIGSADERAYSTVVDFLRRVKRRVVQRAIAVALARMATLLVLGLLLWVGLESLLFLSPFWRTLGAWMIAGSGLVLFVVDTILQLRGRRSLHDVALFVEHRRPDFQQRLITTLELLPANKTALHSSELMSATAVSAADMAAQTKPRGIVDDDRLRSCLRHLGAVGGVSLALCGLLREDMIPALDRCLHPTLAYARASATTVTSLTGDLEVVKGDDAVVHFRVRGEVPPSARILSRESPQMPWDIEEIVLPGTASDSLRYVFAGVRRPLTYLIEAGDGASQPARIDVLEPPVVQRLQVRYAFPPYTGLPDRIDEVSGDVRAIIGTRVDLEIISNKSLGTAAIVIDDSLRLPAQITDTRAHIAWYLSADSTGQGVDANAALDSPRVSGSHYHLELTDHRGIRNRDPIRYAIRPLFDEAPRIAVTEPGRDADLPENLQVVLGLEAHDDFGVAEIELVYRVNDGRERHVAMGDGGGRGRELAVVHAWDLNDLELLPDDLVHYHGRVSDNDLVSGPKQGRSREFTFRYPSLYELMTELSETRSDQIEALDALMAEDDQGTAEFVEQIRRELLKTEELSWQQRKELEATIEQQQERAAAVSELAQQMEETMQAMQESGLASEEILDKLEEIRELMQEVTSPELQEALQSLQDAMGENIEPQELAEALADFAADHEAFQQRLDRTLALLRQVDLEQRLEAAVIQAQDLHSRQELIDEALKEPLHEDTKLQRQEASLSEDTQSLQQELSKLGADARPYDEETANELESLAQDMQENRLSGRMKELSAQLGSQQQQAQARQLGEDLEEELGALSSGLEQVQQEFVASQKQDLLRALKQAMESLVALSFSQEDLLDRTRTRQPTEALPEMADEQFALLNGTGSLIDQLAEVGRKTVNLNLGLPSTLGHVLQGMKEAASLLGSGDGARSTPHQKKALKSMNEAALMLRESADDVRKSRTPSGFGEAMEKMMGLSEQQAALNQATQESLGQGTQVGKEGRPGQDWRSQMGRLAREQRRIQSALSELERELRGHRGARRQLAEIDKEMGTALSEMKRRNPSARLGQSQQRILQRMLDASRSVNTRGFKQERISESAVDPGSYVGPWLPADLGQAPDELREAMKRALSGDYPHEYWDVIRRYYELVYEDVAGENVSPGEGTSLP